MPACFAVRNWSWGVHESLLMDIFFGTTCIQSADIVGEELYTKYKHDSYPFHSVPINKDVRSIDWKVWQAFSWNAIWSFTWTTSLYFIRPSRERLNLMRLWRIHPGCWPLSGPPEGSISVTTNWVCGSKWLIICEGFYYGVSSHFLRHFHKVNIYKWFLIHSWDMEHLTQSDDDDIANVPFYDLLNDDGLLFIWVVNNRYTAALDLIEQWGLQWVSGWGWTNCECLTIPKQCTAINGGRRGPLGVSCEHCVLPKHKLL